MGLEPLVGYDLGDAVFDLQSGPVSLPYHRVVLDRHGRLRMFGEEPPTIFRPVTDGHLTNRHVLTRESAEDAPAQSSDFSGQEVRNHFCLAKLERVIEHYIPESHIAR